MWLDKGSLKGQNEFMGSLTNLIYKTKFHTNKVTLIVQLLDHMMHPAYGIKLYG